jgi:membrane protein
VTETPAVEPTGRAARLLRGPLDVAVGVANALPRAIEDLFRDRLPQYAASISFHVLFSLFPLTIVLVSIFGLVLTDDGLRQDVIDELVDVLPVSESGQQDIASSIEGIATPLSAIGLISLIALLWGASGMMTSLRVGLETALKVERGRPPAHAKLVDFALLGIVGLLVLLVIGLSAFVGFFSRLLDPAAERLGIDDAYVSFFFRDGVQLVLVALLALGLYRFVPARKLRTRGALAGAILTTVLIWGATKVLALLFGDFSRYNLIYGSLAGVMTFLFYVYVVALIILLGAEFAYAWSQPPEPPGPPLTARIAGFFRGLFVHPTVERPADRVADDGAKEPRKAAS